MRKLAALLGISVLLAAAPPLSAGEDLEKARETANRMAAGFQEQGYHLSALEHEGVLTARESVAVNVPLTKNLDYIVLVGGDTEEADLDLYVFDEAGEIIAQDATEAPVAGVALKAPFNGMATVYVVFAEGDGQCAWHMLIGRKGAPQE